MSWKVRRPSLGAIIGSTALVVALSGAALALPGKNTVSSDDIRPGAVKRSDLARNAVNGRKVANESLTAADVDGLATSRRTHNDSAPDDGQFDLGPTLFEEDVLALRGECRLEGDEFTAQVTLLADPGVGFYYDADHDSGSSGGSGTGGTTSFFSFSHTQANSPEGFHFIAVTTDGAMIAGEAMLVVDGPRGDCEFMLNITG